ncbi:MAG: lysophospholipid acyltransferase family protein [Chloroflexi bacterium]|nr:lysophospholipid acyltransferase family protein [Chloroflexota bacterium]
MRRSRERAAVLGYRVAQGALGVIPTAISMPVASGVFRTAYYAWPAKRHIILDNASHVLRKPTTDPDVRRLARRMYSSYARFVVELMRLPSRPADEPNRLMVSEGEGAGGSFRALWEALRDEGRGMLGVSAHIGSIDILAGAFAARGLPIYGVADDSAYPELFELLNESRRRWGVAVIPWRNLREIYRALRGSGIVGLVIDWGYRAEDVPVRLFGAWTTLPAGPAVIAARTRAALVPVICRRRDDGRFEARHFDPIEVTGDSQREIALATQACANAIESMIAAAPEQWYSFKPIWPRTETEARRLEERHAAMLLDGVASRAPRR